MDETLLPLDHRHAGAIVDDELNKELINPLGPGVTLHAVIDACHSGSGVGEEEQIYHYDQCSTNIVAGVLLFLPSNYCPICTLDSRCAPFVTAFYIRSL